MSRKSDLEEHTRKSYNLIQGFEDILRLSDNPKEKGRSQRAIEEQWELVKGCLAEYIPLCERLGLGMSEEITEIAVHFPEYAALENRLEQPRGSDLPMVAIDVCHGARIGRLYVRELQAHGFRTKELSAPLTVNSLSGVRVLTLFVALPDHTGQPLTSEEIATIQSFVAYGGGVFLIGLGWVWKQYGQKVGLTMDDYPLNRISYPQFGIYFGGEPLDDPMSQSEIINGYPCAKFDSTSMRKHPVTVGVYRIFSPGVSSTLQVMSPSISLIWDGNDQDRCVLAAWHMQGQGRVICLQHEGYFKDQNICEFDNLKLLINIVRWLSQSNETSRVKRDVVGGDQTKIDHETHFHGPVTSPVHTGSGDISLQADTNQPSSLRRISMDSAIRRSRTGLIAISTVIATILGIVSNIVAAYLQNQFDLLNYRGRFTVVVAVFAVTLAIGTWLAVKQGQGPS